MILILTERLKIITSSPEPEPREPGVEGAFRAAAVGGEETPWGPVNGKAGSSPARVAALAGTTRSSSYGRIITKMYINVLHLKT